MDIPSAFPSSDLLEQINGIEGGLRKGKKLGIAGAIGLVVSALQIPVIISRSDGINSVREFLSGDVAENWPLYLLLLVVIGSIALIVFTRIWLKESQQSFRYTYSVENFNDVGGGEGEPWVRYWLPNDILHRLSERIGRLSPLNEESYQGDGETPESHVHIAADFVFRESGGRQVLEVMPRIRVGHPGKPETVAHVVRFSLPDPEEGSGATIAAPRGAAPPPRDKDYEEEWVEEEGGSTEEGGGDLSGLEPPIDPQTGESPLDRSNYEMLLERVYFSIASEIYKQIRKDVQKRIDLLPGKRFQAAAYFYEAEDYARSNTLDAYDEASVLYEAAMELYEPAEPRPATSTVKRVWHATAAALRKGASAARRAASRVFPRAAKRDVMTAKAHMGYANMLVYRRVLAGMSGHRANPIFQAGPAAERALELLRSIPDRYPKKANLLFDAHVTLALVQAYAGPLRASRRNVRRAYELQPSRVDHSARYQFVSGILEPSPQASLPLLRRAAELDPRFEVALFELANRSDIMWRRRVSLEGPESRLVSDLYQQVTELNPGNVQAWARLAHISWLLGDDRTAQDQFRRGRYYKEIKHDTFVATLDYGLARIAAEHGDLTEAYHRYTAGLAGRIAQGVPHDPENNPHFYYFDSASEEVLRRFAAFKQTVRAKVRPSRKEESGPFPRRVRDTVLGFALNDYGEICQGRYQWTGSEAYLTRALDAYERASELDPTNVLPHYNLCTAKLRASAVKATDSKRLAGRAEAKLADAPAAISDSRRETGRQLAERAARSLDESNALLEEAVHHARQIVSQEPTWADGRLLLMMAEARRAALSRSQIRDLQRLAHQYREKARALHHRLEDIDQRDGFKRVQAPAYAATKAVGTPRDGDVVQIHETRGDRAWIERQARTQEQRAGRLEERIRSLDEQARASAAAVESGIQDLLPHTWLWTEADGRVEFNWKAVESKDKSIQRSWVTELDDLHVRILATWARARLVLGLEGPRDRERIERLLRCLHDRLVPDDLYVLTALRELKESGHTSARMAMRSRRALPALDVDGEMRFLILRNVKANARSHGALMRLSDPAVGDETRMKLLRAELEHGLEPTVAQRAQEELDRTHLAVGRRLWKQGRVDAAIEHFGAVRSEVDADGLWWRNELVHEIVKEGADDDIRERVDRLKDWLQHEVNKTRTTNGRLDARSALVSLVRTKYELAGRGLSSSQAPLPTAPQATVIALEVDDTLFPKGVNDPLLLDFVKEKLSRIRDDIVDDTGVDIPEITLRVRPDLDDGGYVLALHDVPVAGGAVPLDRYFCSDAVACRQLALGGIETKLPHAPSGVWLDEPGREKAVAAGLEAVDAREYVARHVELSVRRNIAGFLGYQDVQDLVRRWSAGSTSRTRLIDELFTSLNTRLAFACALRMLAEDGVPISDLGAILQAVRGLALRSSEPASIIETARPMVDAARLMLKERLPGNEPWRKQVAIPEQTLRRLGRGIRHVDGIRFLALEPKVAQGILTSIYNAIGPDKLERATLVVRDADVRPFVRRLVARGPHPIPVLVRAEVMDRANHLDDDPSGARAPQLATR